MVKGGPSPSVESAPPVVTLSETSSDDESADGVDESPRWQVAGGELSGRGGGTDDGVKATGPSSAVAGHSESGAAGDSGGGPGPKGSPDPLGSRYGIV